MNLSQASSVKHSSLSGSVLDLSANIAPLPDGIHGMGTPSPDPYSMMAGSENFAFSPDIPQGRATNLKPSKLDFCISQMSGYAM
jgi:hypothetical protein